MTTPRVVCVCAISSSQSVPQFPYVVVVVVIIHASSVYVRERHDGFGLTDSMLNSRN